MPILHLPTSEKTRPKVIRRYARRRVQAIQRGGEEHQEFALEDGHWVWRPEGSYHAILKERLNSYSIPRRDCLGSNGALFRPQLVQATTKNGGIKFLKFNCSLSKILTP